MIYGFSLLSLLCPPAHSHSDASCPIKGLLETAAHQTVYHRKHC